MLGKKVKSFSMRFGASSWSTSCPIFRIKSQIMDKICRPKSVKNKVKRSSERRQHWRIQRQRLKPLLTTLPLLRREHRLVSSLTPSATTTHALPTKVRRKVLLPAKQTTTPRRPSENRSGGSDACRLPSRTPWSIRCNRWRPAERVATIVS